MNQTVNVSDASAASDGIHAALESLTRDRKQGLAALNDLFRSGKAPTPALDGSYNGKLLALNIAPVIDQSLEFITSFWMPWGGEHLSTQKSVGENIFKLKYWRLLKILFPFYKYSKEGSGDSFRAFAFKTSVSAGILDLDIDTLKLDYDLPNNPKLTIRPIINEIVQIADGVYLGKIHFKNWFGNWKMIGYFSLRNKVESVLDGPKDDGTRPINALPDTEIELDNAKLRAAYLLEIKSYTAAEIRSLSPKAKPKNRSEPASRWKREKRIFAIRHSGSDLFPCFQFVDGSPLPVIKKVLTRLPNDMTPWQIAFWFASGNGWLSGKAPQEALNDVESVLGAADRMREMAIG